MGAEETRSRRRAALCWILVLDLELPKVIPAELSKIGADVGREW